LIFGKTLYIHSKRPDPQANEGTNFELLMPLEDYWKVQELLKRSDHLSASDASKPEITQVHNEIFKVCAPFAVHEKDRLWLTGLKRT